MDFLFNDELNRSLRSLNDANDGLGGGGRIEWSTEEDKYFVGVSAVL